MRVMVLGVRGIPGIAGGVETHAEELYPRLAKLGCSVQVLVRSPWADPRTGEFGGVSLRSLWSPRATGFEALGHSLLGVLYAGLARPDVLHIHAVGPAIVTPLARLLGLTVVVTHHGPDYDRDKWGRFARAVLRAGEWGGMRFAQGRIVISRVIAALVRERHHRDSDLIPNGVAPVAIEPGDEALRRFGLERGRYVLQVSRLVPEKRQLDLIAAFAAARLPGCKLVLVGGIDQSAYSQELQRVAAATPGVVLTGLQRGTALRELYSHAGVFVLPSSHEGLPIAMLEALSFGLPVIASDIPANLEVGLPAGNYFPLGDRAALQARIEEFVAAEEAPGSREARRAWVLERYDWDDVARATLNVYRRVTDA